MSDYYTHGVHGIYYIAAVLRGGTEKGPGEVPSGLLSDPRLAEAARGAEFRP